MLTYYYDKGVGRVILKCDCGFYTGSRLKTDIDKAPLVKSYCERCKTFNVYDFKTLNLSKMSTKN